jgi:hypothetical protein
MKLIRNTILIALLCLLSPAQADPFSGQVYGVYPEGVMVDYGGGSYLVPTQHATFQLGGLTATWSSLQPGQAVNVIVPDPYWNNVVRVPDPYQWKMKYHPTHPPGGPPGQTKKMYNNGNNGNGNNGKGNKGKGKWK